MNIQELQKQIIDKQLNNLYVFLGEEIAIQKIYINKIAEINKLKQENVWQEINPNGNIIIFKYNNLDKRNKFYKQFENDIVEFNKLSNEVLIKYIQREVPLNETNCKKLINICNSSYNQILLELDKIKNYKDLNFETLTGDSFIPDDTRFDILEKQGAFHKEISDITFTFIEKVIIRDIKQVYELQKQLKQIRGK